MKNRIIFVLAIIAIFVVSTSTVDAWCLWGIIGNTCGVKGGELDEKELLPGAEESHPGAEEVTPEDNLPSAEPPSSEEPIPGTTTPSSEDPLPSNANPIACGDLLCVEGEEDSTSDIYCPADCEDDGLPNTVSAGLGNDNSASTATAGGYDEENGGDDEENDGDLSVNNLDASGRVQISNELSIPLSIDSSHEENNYIRLSGEVVKNLGLIFDFPGAGESFLIWDDDNKKFKFFAGGNRAENIKMTISEDGDVITGSNTFKHGYKAGKARLEVVDEVNDESYIRISNKPEGNSDNNVAGFIASAEGMNIYMKAYSPTYAEDETKQRLAELGTGAGHNAPLAINVGGWEVARFHPGRRNNDGEVTRSPSIESNGDFVIRLSPKKYPIRKEVEDDEDEEDEEEYNV